jgi:hypothetical protein
VSQSALEQQEAAAARTGSTASQQVQEQPAKAWEQLQHLVSLPPV